MSKESLEKLNKDLVQYMEAHGDKPAVYYAPFTEGGDLYWNASKKIAFCNLEQYDDHKEITGIEKFLAQGRECNPKGRGGLFGWVDGGVELAIRTIIMNYLLIKTLSNKENFETITETMISDLKKELKKPNTPIYYDIFEEMYNSVYFNLRLTLNQTGYSKKDDAAIAEFFKKDNGYYINYQRNFIEAIDPDILIVGSQDACRIINNILPDLDKPLSFDSDEPSKRGKLSVFSIYHLSGNGVPTGFKMNQYIAKKINCIKNVAK